MLADVEELEAMVRRRWRLAATLGPRTRGAADLAELLRTVLDEAGDARPDVAARLRCPMAHPIDGPRRPLGLKRAIANLVANAVNYGGCARVTLQPRCDGGCWSSRSRMKAQVSLLANWTESSSRFTVASHRAARRPVVSGSGCRSPENPSGPWRRCDAGQSCHGRCEGDDDATG